MREPPKTVHIYYDGTCTLCSGIVNTLGNSSQGSRFTPKDIHTSELPPGISAASAEHDVHVVDDNGAVYVGADAVLKIIAQYPQWRWLASVGALPFILPIARWGYTVVARSRHAFNLKH